MDNPLSTPQLKLPTVPSDFNGGVGVDFARALMRLLEGATLAGGTQDSSQPFDVAALQQDVENLTTELNDSKRKMRVITMTGVDDGQITVPFPDNSGWNLSDRS
jgi:ferric-dicitrate binding protein FerR (iron transport regulator)